MKYPVFIPTIPQVLDVLMDQVRHQVVNTVNFNESGDHRPDAHLKCFLRYLHFEKPQQREGVSWRSVIRC